MKKAVSLVCLYGVLLMGAVFWGCDGNSSREAVDDTVKELSGQKHVERMNKIKKNIQTTRDQQSDRYRATEEEPEEETSN